MTLTEKNINNSPWLTIKEACDYVKCGRTKMMQIINSGNLKYYRLDKNRNQSGLRILKRDLNRYMLFDKKVRLSKHEKQLLTVLSK